jgi:hypothetical protein
MTSSVFEPATFWLVACTVINVCMYRNWCEGIVAEKHSIHSMVARVRAFMSANDSFRYRQLQQQSMRNLELNQRCYQIFSTVERPVYLLWGCLCAAICCNVRVRSEKWDCMCQWMCQSYGSHSYRFYTYQGVQMFALPACPYDYLDICYCSVCMICVSYMVWISRIAVADDVNAFFISNTECSFCLSNVF